MPKKLIIIVLSLLLSLIPIEVKTVNYFSENNAVQMFSEVEPEESIDPIHFTF